MSYRRRHILILSLIYLLVLPAAKAEDFNGFHTEFEETKKNFAEELRTLLLEFNIQGNLDFMGPVSVGDFTVGRREIEFVSASKLSEILLTKANKNLLFDSIKYPRFVDRYLRLCTSWVGNFPPQVRVYFPTLLQVIQPSQSTGSLLLPGVLRGQVAVQLVTSIKDLDQHGALTPDDAKKILAQIKISSESMRNSRQGNQPIPYSAAIVVIAQELSSILLKLKVTEDFYLDALWGVEDQIQILKKKLGSDSVESEEFLANSDAASYVLRTAPTNLQEMPKWANRFATKYTPPNLPDGCRLAIGGQ